MVLTMLDNYSVIVFVSSPKFHESHLDAVPELFFIRLVFVESLLFFEHVEVVPEPLESAALLDGGNLLLNGLYARSQQFVFERRSMLGKRPLDVPPHHLSQLLRLVLQLSLVGHVIRLV